MDMVGHCILKTQKILQFNNVIFQIISLIYWEDLL
jgi:hypothetical protein